MSNRLGDRTATQIRKGENMSFFQNIEKVKAAGAHSYIGPGEYDLEVVLAKTDVHPGDGTPFFLIEYKVLTATEGSKNRQGILVTHMFMQRGNKQQQEKVLGEVKSAIAAIMSIDPDQIDAKGCLAFVGEAQPGKGKTVRVTARNKKTKVGKDFTVITYHNPALEAAA